MAYKRNKFGSIIVQGENGTFTVTKKEQKMIDQLTRKANRIRDKKAESFYNSVQFQANMKGISQKSYKNLLNQRGFITEKYSAKKNMFNSKEELKEYIKELKTVTKKDYGNKRLDNVRNWMLDKVKKEHNNNKELKDIITNITNNELLTIYLHNDNLLMEIYGCEKIDVEEEGGEHTSALTQKTIANFKKALRDVSTKRK